MLKIEKFTDVCMTRGMHYIFVILTNLNFWPPFWRRVY